MLWRGGVPHIHYYLYYYYYFSVQKRGDEKREGPVHLQSLLDEVEEGRGNRASHAPMRWKKENLDRSLAGDGGDSGVVMLLL